MLAPRRLGLVTIHVPPSNGPNFGQEVRRVVRPRGASSRLSATSRCVSTNAGRAQNRLASEALISIAPTSTGFESLLLPLASMRSRMTFSAQCDQVLFLVATRLVAEFEVVYLRFCMLPQFWHRQSSRSSTCRCGSRKFVASSLSRRVLVGIFFMRPARRPQIEKPPVKNWAGTCSSLRWIAEGSSEFLCPSKRRRESPHRSFPSSNLDTCPTPASPGKRFCMRPASGSSCRTRSVIGL